MIVNILNVSPRHVFSRYLKNVSEKKAKITLNYQFKTIVVDTVNDRCGEMLTKSKNKHFD